MTLSLFSSPLRRIFAVAAFVLVGLANVWASDNTAPLAAATDSVVLTIGGKVRNTNTPNQADFDLAMLMAMPSQSIETTTPWTEGVTRFEGVAVRDVLARVAAQGIEGVFTALNDYTVRIPLESFSHSNAIIAYRMNGEFMRVRDKGPLWIVYPLDNLPASQSVLYQDRMIWQLRSITVK